MDLFSRSNLKAAPVKVKQVKTWITEILNLDEQVTGTPPLNGGHMRASPLCCHRLHAAKAFARSLFL